MISVLRHEVAQFLLDIVDWFLKLVGLYGQSHVQETLYVVLVMAITLLISHELRKLVLFITQRLPLFRTMFPIYSASSISRPGLLCHYRAGRNLIHHSEVRHHISHHNTGDRCLRHFKAAMGNFQ